jgi:TonB family protein
LHLLRFPISARTLKANRYLVLDYAATRNRKLNIELQHPVKGIISLLALACALNAFAQVDPNDKNDGLPAFKIDSVEQRPIWPGCEELTSEDERFKCFNYQMIRYIQQNFTLPSAKNRKEELERTGKVYVQFIIEKNGRVNEAKIIRGVHPDVDQEAQRMVESIPKMADPARVNGKPVRMLYTLPIKVQYR